MRLALIVATITTAVVTLPAAAAPSQQMRPARVPPAQLPAPAPIPDDTLHGGARFPLASLDLPAPTNLTNTNDYAQCTKHGGFGAGLACKASLPGGSMALIWQYPAQQKVIGFHVYILNVASPDKLLVDTQALGATTTIAIEAPQYPNPDRCYAVTAYTASQESDLSNLFCQSGGIHLMQKTDLAAATWRSSALLNITKTNETARTPVTPMVGYSYATTKGTLASGDFYQNFAMRTGVMFDVTPFGSQHIVSATLKLEVNRTWTNRFFLTETGAASDDSLPDSHAKSCIAKILQGGDRWTKNGDWIEDGALIAETGVSDGPDITVDVTKIVRAWASGQENRGIVLEGEEENLTAFTEKACVTQYFPESLQLEIVSY
jgi:hypothetical protein